MENEAEANDFESSDDEQTRRSSHGSTLRDVVSIVYYEMDKAWNRDAIRREHVHRWGKMLRVAIEPDDHEPVDSTWLKQIGGTEDSYKYIQFGRALVFACDSGQWVAYSRASSHWHKLVEVTTRREVQDILRALKLDA